MLEKKNVFVSAGVVGLATLLSRLLGFARDVVIASFFGAGFYTDAFFVAFRIPNLLRKLFAEGSLTISFIPVFSKILVTEGREESFDLAESAFKWLFVAAVLVAALGAFLAPVVVELLAPGFACDPEKLRLTVSLTRMMFPYVVFIGLVALSMGVLNSLGHFSMPAFAPVMLNLSMIAAAFLLSPFFREPVMALAWGVLAGGMVQLLIQLPPLYCKGLRLKSWRFSWHPGLRRICTLILPAVLGAAVYQINVLIGTALASMLQEGSVSYLYYADRLVQFPLAVFAISTATAVLPAISGQAPLGNLAGVRKTFSEGIRFVTYLVLPSMTGLMVLREPLVRLLFQRGAFGSAATAATAEAVFFYSTGLLAFSALRIVVAVFNALSDTKMPLKTGAVAIAANILLCLFLAGPLGHGGIAFATSLASFLNLVLLLWRLHFMVGGIPWGEIFRSGLRALLLSAVMGGVVGSLERLFLPQSGSQWVLLVGLAALISSGVLVYLLLSKITGNSDFNIIRAALKNR